MDKRYIHYNSDVFDKERLKRALTYNKKYRKFDKPFGLWASPVDSQLGWKEWCECERFRLESLEKSFTFTLSPEAKILTINNLKDAASYVIEDCKELRDGRLDFYYDRLDLANIYENYDAMEVNISNDYRFRNSVFHGWDVDSICIWNPDIISTKN